MSHSPDYILIVDGNNIVARNVHANSELLVRKGKKAIFTGGLYGTLQSLRVLVWNDLFKRISGIIVCQDTGRPTYRTKLCPEYKGNRTPIDDLRRAVERGKATKKEKREYEMLRKMLDQNERLSAFLEPFGIATIRIKGWEADDVAAYLVKRVFTKKRFPDQKVLLYSGDGDWTQLVGKRVHQRTPGSKGKLLKRTGKHARLLKTMCGDSADNLKGLMGVGPKKAEQLLEEAGFPTTPKELRSAVKKLEIDTTKGPAKLLLEQWESFVAQWKATSMKVAVKKMDATALRVALTHSRISKKECRKTLREHGIKSLQSETPFDELTQAFGSAFTKGRMAGVFDALQEIT